MKIKIILAMAICIISLSITAQECALNVNNAINFCQKYTKQQLLNYFGVPQKTEEQEDDGGRIIWDFSYPDFNVVLDPDGYISYFGITNGNTSYKINNVIGIGDPIDKIYQLNGMVKIGTFWGDTPAYMIFMKDKNGKTMNSPLVFYESNGKIETIIFTIMN